MIAQRVCDGRPASLVEEIVLDRLRRRFGHLGAGLRVQGLGGNRGDEPGIKAQCGRKNGVRHGENSHGIGLL